MPNSSKNSIERFKLPEWIKVGIVTACFSLVGHFVYVYTTVKRQEDAIAHLKEELDDILTEYRSVHKIVMEIKRDVAVLEARSAQWE